MEIVSACLARDLPIYKVTCDSLRRFIPDAEIHVITRKQDFRKFQDACGTDITIWDENDLIPEMTMAQLRQMPFSFFPQGAGWYFQQFLKFAFEKVSGPDEHYLIWDADTVLLKPLEFFDQEGRALYTMAEEHHSPYFETFEALFQQPATRQFSFISQHQIIEKRLLREMLSEIERKHASSRNWAWAIMENLKGEGTNLFSEYETYGHYARIHRPGSVAFRSLPWIRNGSSVAGYPPNQKSLDRLAKLYSFAAFEVSDTRPRRVLRWLKEKIRSR
jgi:hypothetical protein